MMVKRRVLGLLVVTGLVAAGCGSDEAASDIDLSGVSLTVGSKNFTEQYVLSEILIQAMAGRGAEVTDATDTGTTDETRQALVGGEIDAYFEYNSTGWVEILGESERPDEDGEDLTEDVRRLDAANGIEWVGRSTFNDTYGFAMGPELASDTQTTRYSVEAFDLDAMAEYVEDNDDATVCVEPEFAERADGLSLFEEEVGFAIPQDQLVVVENESDIYEMTEDGDCDFGEVFTTDGRLETFDLELVVDNGVFYVYNVSLNIRSDAAGEQLESIESIVDAILGPMSQSRITDLNRRVSDGEPVADVAESFLDEFDIV